MEILIDDMKLIQENPSSNVYELVLDDGEELSFNDLKELNGQGFVYHSEQTGIDFEDEDEDGNLFTRYMNIYYFSKAERNIHASQIPM